MKEWKSPLLGQHLELATAFDLLDGWIEHKMQEQRLPGLCAGVVYDQELLWAKGFGYSDVERHIPAETDTLYRIASITKLFTALAILKLRDEGMLRLDDPITSHLPWFQMRFRHDDAPPITVRHLLTHTSGLPRDASTPMWTDAVFPSRDEMIAALPERETALPPGTRWKYSNLGYALLGEIVAMAAGEPYGDVIQSRLFKPMGMNGSFILPEEAQDSRLCAGYCRLDREGQRAVAPFMNAEGFSPAFSAASSVEDLAKFLSWQIRQDSSVLKSSTLREMQRVHWLDEEWKSGHGLGFSVKHVEDRVLVGHGGAAPGHTTTLQLSVKEKLGVIVLTNVIAGDPMTYALQAFEILGSVVKRTLAVPEAIPAFDPSWNRYLGRYGNRWGDSLVGMQEGRLAIQSISHPELPAGHLVPEGEGVFRMEKGSHDGELVVFEADEAGTIHRMRVGGEYFDRIF